MGRAPGREGQGGHTREPSIGHCVHAHAHARLRTTIRTASAGVGHGALVVLIVRAAVAGEHLLVIGPPGTAESEAVRRTARALGGTSFEYLLGRFTEPSERFGPGIRAGPGSAACWSTTTRWGAAALVFRRPDRGR